VVKMTDEPFPVGLLEEANVTIGKVEARRSSEDQGSPFRVLSEEDISLNLLELTNGITATLADLEVPAGEYDLVRLYVEEASVVMVDGRIFDLKVPSGAQTGIKVFIDPVIEVSGGITSELLLDFDVSRSFKVQGNINTPAGINGFIFTPVIKATNLSTSGRLTGTVTGENDEGLQGAQITVYAADTLNTRTFTGEGGHYTVLGLQSGSYDVEANLGEYQQQMEQEVIITSGNETIVDFELEPVEDDNGDEDDDE